MDAPRHLSLPAVLLAVSLAAATASVGCGEPVTTDFFIIDGWTHYGAGADGDEFLALDAVLADPAAHDGEPVRIEATIDAVCQSKGCWMTLDGPDGPEEVRVTFTDYAFFVPKDIAGRAVRIDGTFEVREIPADEVKHFLEDEGRHEEAAAVTGPRKGYRIVADGVGVREQD